MFVHALYYTSQSLFNSSFSLPAPLPPLRYDPVYAHKNDTFIQRDGLLFGTEDSPQGNHQLRQLMSYDGNLETSNQKPGKPIRVVDSPTISEEMGPDFYDNWDFSNPRKDLNSASNDYDTLSMHGLSLSSVAIGQSAKEHHPDSVNRMQSLSTVKYGFHTENPDSGTAKKVAVDPNFI